MSSKASKTKRRMRMGKEGGAAAAEEGSKGKAPREKRNAPERVFVLTMLHLQCVALMGLIFVVGSIGFPYIDRSTLKPNDSFPSWLKAVSYAVNVPMKLGLFHMVLYGIELFRDHHIFTFHTGQRLTTLWFQFFQHQRWGQHLHMQTETLLQIVDVYQSDGFRTYTVAEKTVLASGACVLCVTNLITSVAYHTWEEQVIGYLITLAKLFVDYGYGTKVNQKIGRSLRSWHALVGGFIAVAVIVALSKLMLSSSASKVVSAFMLHPTVLATGIFVAGFGYHYVQELLQ